LETKLALANVVLLVMELSWVVCRLEWFIVEPLSSLCTSFGQNQSTGVTTLLSYCLRIALRNLNAGLLLCIWDMAGMLLICRGTLSWLWGVFRGTSW
jgi:hypothetical protein